MRVGPPGSGRVRRRSRHGAPELAVPGDLRTSLPIGEVFRTLATGSDGLTEAEALLRCAGTAAPKARRPSALPLFLAQFRSPIQILLAVAAGLSFFLRDRADAVIIAAILIASGILGFRQEFAARRTLEALLAAVRVRVEVRRSGAVAAIPAEEVVPGDILLLRAGNILAGDARLVEARDLHADEAALTGETFPAEKAPGECPAATPLARQSNMVFRGTHVVSGTGTAVVVGAGADTELGRIAKRLRRRPPETEFERGVRRFGALLLELTLTMTLALLAVNAILGRPILDSALFALALAVGLTPQLLPAILMSNLAFGARRLAEVKVIVKRPAAIEDFGGMDVLCSDKTGTLTTGVVSVAATVDAEGRDAPDVLAHAFINAALATGFSNPIDDALRAARPFDPAALRKWDEVPYDFIRKRLSILAEWDGRPRLVTKGAVAAVLAASASIRASGGDRPLTAEDEAAALRRADDFAVRGWRTIAVGVREWAGAPVASREDEAGLTFLGLVALEDPVKADVAETVAALRGHGVAFKVITGDRAAAAGEALRRIGVEAPAVLTGGELRVMSEDALVRRAPEVDVFAEVEPNQKERIILALRKAGHTVGFLGDGINDAPALHAADVGLSVDTAVDVAKEAADIVLLDKSLAVLLTGIRLGRRIFANTLKYVFMATSANFGNMLSMAAASLVLPFLPLLPKQILLTNILTDIPEMAIGGDATDEEMTARPRRWDVRFIRSFMLTFGLLSSLFDLATFAVLLLVLRADAEIFRTGWFVESVISAGLVVLVIRTRRPAWRSRPSRGLALGTLAVAAATALLPLLPFAGKFGFVKLPARFYVLLAVVVAIYLGGSELVKRIFYARHPS